MYVPSTFEQTRMCALHVLAADKNKGSRRSIDKNSKYRITLHVAPETMVACGHCLLGLAFMRLALVQPYDEMAYRRWTGVSVLSSHILPMCDLMKRTHRNRRDIRHVSSGSGMRREPIVNDLGNGIRLSINVDKRGRSVAASRRRQTR